MFWFQSTHLWLVSTKKRMWLTIFNIDITNCLICVLGGRGILRLRLLQWRRHCPNIWVLFWCRRHCPNVQVLFKNMVPSAPFRTFSAKWCRWHRFEKSTQILGQCLWHHVWLKVIKLCVLCVTERLEKYEYVQYSAKNTQFYILLTFMMVSYWGAKNLLIQLRDKKVWTIFISSQKSCVILWL